MRVPITNGSIHTSLPRARNTLLKEQRITKIQEENAPWFHSQTHPYGPYRKGWPSNCRSSAVCSAEVWEHESGSVSKLLSSGLSFFQDTLDHFGSFTNLGNHDDSRLYSKEEPPQSLSGKRLSGDQRLDFLIRHPEAGWAGIEAKNVREWLYPNRDEVTDLLAKAVALGLCTGVNRPPHSIRYIQGPFYLWHGVPPKLQPTPAGGGSRVSGKG